MTQGPEAKLTKATLKRLRELPMSWWVKFPGSRFKGGIPDILGCYRGKFVAIEMKAPETGHELTLLQANTIKKIQAAGGRAGVAYAVHEALEIAHGDR